MFNENICDHGETIPGWSLLPAQNIMGGPGAQIRSGRVMNCSERSSQEVTRNRNYKMFTNADADADVMIHDIVTRECVFIDKHHLLGHLTE